MDFLWIGSLIIFGGTVLSVLVEPRRIRNAFYVMLSLGWLVVLVTYFLVKSDDPVGRYVVIGAGLLLPVLYLALAVFLIVNGVVILRKEGRRLANTLSLLMGLMMLIIPVFLLLASEDLLPFVPSSVVLGVSMAAFYFGGTFCTYTVYSVLYCLLPKNPRCDYIIIHGAALKKDGTPTPLLCRRVEKAVRVYEKCKQKPILVPSGGQGSDEVMSEAQSMRNYLITLGIPAEQILMEDRSATTFENLQNVKEILDARAQGRKYRCLFVTNNYHLLRTGLFARKIHLDAQGVGCRTAKYYLPSAFIREYIAVIMYYKWVSAVVLLICLLTARAGI